MEAELQLAENLASARRVTNNLGSVRRPRESEGEREEMDVDRGRGQRSPRQSSNSERTMRCEHSW